MAAETPVVRNKGLLIVALVLAGAVVIVYNVHIRQVRRAGRGQNVSVLRFVRDMEAGEEITRKDLEHVDIDKRTAANLGDLLDELNYAVTCTVNQSVRKNEFLRWGHVTQEDASQPSRQIGRGMVAVSLEIDSRRTQGDILRVGDRVNICGALSVGGGLRAYRIIEGLRILAVGGRGLHERTENRRTRTMADKPLRSYNSITIEVEPKVSLELANVLSRIRGKVWIELRNPDDLASPAPGINPALRKVSTLPQQRKKLPGI